ncbi:hypothetical protein JFT64_18260 [Pseudomonas carnis]|jgi:hypothetical protein|uniref:hypothetical protein n=1 Tax=Pseudomonas carnis TaxID=2487355 RepID=UPI0018E84FC1|nr:hypothetical protein [Pseudomonas carnis]MBJ2213990.1 hypothetical protein [Pseudomonas carnis]
MTTDHTLFEGFHADPRFADLRKFRSQLQPVMRVLSDNVTGFKQGTTTLRPEKVLALREYVLQMLQLQHAMTEACKTIPPEFEPVKARILADFDTEEPKAYLKQVNGWLRMIESSAPDPTPPNG